MNCYTGKTTVTPRMCCTKKKITIVEWKVSARNALSVCVCELVNRYQCRKKVSTQLQQTFPAKVFLINEYLSTLICALFAIFTGRSHLRFVLLLPCSFRCMKVFVLLNMPPLSTISQILCLQMDIFMR